MNFIDFNLFTKLLYGLICLQVVFALVLACVNKYGATWLPQTVLPQTASLSWAELTRILTDVVPVDQIHHFWTCVLKEVNRGARNVHCSVILH